jgi:hypothetical protein
MGTFTSGLGRRWRRQRPRKSASGSLRVWSGFETVVEGELQVLRLPQSSGELRLGKSAMQVGEGAGGSGHRDVVAAGDGARIERARAMDPDARAGASIPRNGHVHETPLGKELPERRGAGVTEDGIGAAGEHRRHPWAFLAEAPMPDGVHTAMKAVEALGGDASPSTALVDAGAFELCNGDHAVLVRRNPGNDGVRMVVGEFPSHGGR